MLAGTGTGRAGIGAVPPAPGRRPRILDVGCGDGTVAARLALESGGTAVALDWAGDAATRARERGLAALRGSTAEPGLPLADASFDVVCLSEVLEHLVDPDLALIEARRVLRAGGTLLVSTPNLAAWFNRLLLLAGVQPAFSEVSRIGIFGRPGRQVVGHLRLFTGRALREMLVAHGFSEVRLAGASYHDVPRPAAGLDRALARRPGVAAILVARAIAPPGPEPAPRPSSPAEREIRAGAGTGGDGIGRSVRLLAAFRVEQSQPERFYRLLAEDSVDRVSRHVDLRGLDVLDAGGGPGWFAEEFRRAGARCHVVERDAAELLGARGDDRPLGPCDSRSGGPLGPWASATLADGAALPFREGSFGLCFTSNVLEHVATPWAFLDELVRTARRGGFLYVAFTNWFSPWGGHETSPWHYLGGDRAARRYERHHGRPPKNLIGHTLHRVDVSQVLRWARRHPDVEVVDTRPRYLPGWCRRVVSVPGVREVATWNLAMLLRRR